MSSTPESHGWLRRPDLDLLGGTTYELPDGTLYMFNPNHKPETMARALKHYEESRVKRETEKAPRRRE